ncbi:MAG: dTDP-4-dehydrorhamnose 3,5-epimerase [Alphaproteobacteria bacterium]|nr:MAG: dTDP-4-dehydrorhamnose 3,5-epimerase [Alphaproteobacteria bacterium]
MLNVTKTTLPEVLILEPRKFEDNRGFFSETYNLKRAQDMAGIPTNFVQDNVSLSKKKGTVRGIHFQKPPFAQDKLVRVLKGRILDIAVDLRQGSPNFGQSVGVELSSDNFLQLFIPKGFGHAFCTLADDTEVQYKVTDYYTPEHDAGIIWNDETLNIQWPFPKESLLLSEKDQILPPFSELHDFFTYEQVRL